jgi:hypothetical protein
VAESVFKLAEGGGQEGAFFDSITHAADFAWFETHFPNR